MAHDYLNQEGVVQQNYENHNEETMSLTNSEVNASQRQSHLESLKMLGVATSKHLQALNEPSADSSRYQDTSSREFSRRDGDNYLRSCLES